VRRTAADLAAVVAVFADAALIGVYTTRENAEAALARVRDQPGFRDYPDKFEIYEQKFGSR
jgi:hypothetical protein